MQSNSYTWVPVSLVNDTPESTVLFAKSLHVLVEYLYVTEVHPVVFLHFVRHVAKITPFNVLLPVVMGAALLSVSL